MKLSELTVEHFRSIKKCHIRFNEVMAVIGENNAGKTALLRALNSVFNWKFEEKYFKDNTHQYAPRAVTKITLCFEKLPNKEIYNGKKDGDKLVLSLSYSYGNSTRKKALACITNNSVISVDDNFLKELKKDIDYVYIPAGRGNRDLTWNENSIFSRVLTSYSQFYTQSRDTISAKTARVAENLKQSVFSKIENELKKATMLDTDEVYSFDYTKPIDYSVFLDKVGLSISEPGNKFSVTECGSGIKSLSVIALYRTLAKIENVNVILGIEEPETNLHPQAQKKLIASIKNNRQDSEIQAIMATHSTVIVDELNHEDIILAQRVSDERRGFFTKFTQIEENFWDKYSLNEYKENKFFRYKNSDFFFSRYVIVVESTTDAQVINQLISDRIGEKIYYVSILSLDGVKNLKYPYFLLKSLGIPFSMVVDKDVLTQYKNGSLDASRNAETQLPEYNNIANLHNLVLNDLWPSNQDKDNLSAALRASYAKLFKFCRPHKLYPMQYCLEMDLVSNKYSKQKYCNAFGILNDENAANELLIKRKDAIKDSDKIMRVVNALTPSQYPYSYKRIRTALVEDICAAF